MSGIIIISIQSSMFFWINFQVLQQPERKLQFVAPFYLFRLNQETNEECTVYKEYTV
jgi:hypothetical protein